MRRRPLVILSVVVLALGGLVAAPAAWAAAAVVTCPAVTWGSTPEVAPTYSQMPLGDVRTGRHTCFDRIVLDVAGPAPNGWRVQYVDELVQQGSGEPVAVPGGAVLEVMLHHPVADPVDGFVAFNRPLGPVADVSGYSTLRAVHYAGSFEGQTQFGVGVRARLPFRVFSLDGPEATSRVVVDVAHKWTAW